MFSLPLDFWCVVWSHKWRDLLDHDVGSPYFRELTGKKSECMRCGRLTTKCPRCGYVDSVGCDCND